jgi:predicted DNA-binding transcriptional regulator AlpA
LRGFILPRMSKEKFLTREDVASALGYSIQTIKRWELNGMGPQYIKVGKLIAYRVEDVEEWVRERLGGAEKTARSS